MTEKKEPFLAEARLRELVAEGLGDVQIADKLGCSKRSVERYRQKWEIPPASAVRCARAAMLGAEASAETRGNLAPKGRGGDAEFSRLMLAKGFSFGRSVAPRREFAPIGRLMS